MNDTVNTPEPIGQRVHRLALLLLALAGVFGYYNSLRGAFVFDDVVYIKLPDIAKPFANEMVRGRPVVSLSLAMNYWADQLKPRGYHVVNLVVHILAAYVLYDLVRRTLLLPKWAGRFTDRAEVIAILVALIWLIHPLNTQSVTYVIQRCESMMGLFFLLTMNCFVIGTQSERHANQWYLVAAFSCLLGAGCKEVIAVIPFVIALYDVAFISNSWRGLLRHWKFYSMVCVPVAMIVAWTLFRGTLTEEKGSVGLGVGLFTPKTYALTQTQVILYYLQLSVWPDALCLDYLDWRPVKNISDSWLSVGAIAGLVLVMICGVLYRTWWGFLLAVFALILAPTSTIIPVQDVAFEHRMYLPLAAMIVFIAVLIDAGLVRLRHTNHKIGRWATRGVVATTLVVAILLGIRTLLRNEDYATTIRMYSDIVQKRPNNPRGHYSLAVALHGTGQTDAAAVEAKLAAELVTDDPLYTAMHGWSLLETDRPAEALPILLKAYQQGSKIAKLPLDIGTAYLVLGKPQEAVLYLVEGRNAEPNLTVYRIWLGIAYQQLKRDAEADVEFNAALAIDPTQATQLDRSIRYAALQRDPSPTLRKMTLFFAQAAVRLSGEKAGAYDTLAISLATSGQFDQAVLAERTAVTKARAIGAEYLAQRYEARLSLFQKRLRYLPENIDTPTAR